MNVKNTLSLKNSHTAAGSAASHTHVHSAGQLL